MKYKFIALLGFIFFFFASKANDKSFLDVTIVNNKVVFKTFVFASDSNKDYVNDVANWIKKGFASKILSYKLDKSNNKIAVKAENTFTVSSEKFNIIYRFDISFRNGCDITIRDIIFKNADKTYNAEDIICKTSSYFPNIRDGIKSNTLSILNDIVNNITSILNKD